VLPHGGHQKSRTAGPGLAGQLPRAAVLARRRQKAQRHNLHTRDLAEAQRLRPHALSEIHEQLEQARKSIQHHPDPIIDRALSCRQSQPVRLVDGVAVADISLQAAIMAEEMQTISRVHGPRRGATVQTGCHRQGLHGDRCRTRNIPSREHGASQDQAGTPHRRAPPDGLAATAVTWASPKAR
jgi:hypothetical protein